MKKLEELLALLLSGDLSGIPDDELAAHEATLLAAFAEMRTTARSRKHLPR